MRIVFVIHTPGQAHFWRFPIHALKERGNDLCVLARDDGLTCELLHRHGIEFSAYGKAGRARAEKIARLPAHFWNSFTTARRFKPDIVVGVGIIEAYTSLLLGKPCIIFEDSETTPLLEKIQWLRLASAIITPGCFRFNLGKKHVRLNGYKEMAYLHPNYFKPDPQILDELDVKKDEKYIILRFNSFDAIHDLGLHGFSLTAKYELVRKLGKYGKIFVSTEGDLPSDIGASRLPISPHRIHHALYFAQMLVSDTGTMTTEAAILGTPACVCQSARLGNFEELHRKYDLIFASYEAEQVIGKAIEMIQQPHLKEQWAKKREYMLSDKVDVTRYMVDFIEKYPDSFEEYKKKKYASNKTCTRC